MATYCVKLSLARCLFYGIFDLNVLDELFGQIKFVHNIFFDFFVIVFFTGKNVDANLFFFSESVYRDVGKVQNTKAGKARVYRNSF